MCVCSKTNHLWTSLAPSDTSVRSMTTLQSRSSLHLCLLTAGRLLLANLIWIILAWMAKLAAWLMEPGLLWQLWWLPVVAFAFAFAAHSFIYIYLPWNIIRHAMSNTIVCMMFGRTVETFNTNL
jgi:hypothetical protein